MIAMGFAELRPQLDKLSREEMLKALAHLKSRLRANDPENEKELSRIPAEMDGGKKVRWEDLKRQLGLS